MGCGGSRADAIEPRYQESWTRETESTWLTSTDAETPNGVTSKIPAGECSGPLKENPKQSGTSVEARPSLSFRERRMVNAGIQCETQPLSSGICTDQQRRSHRSCCVEQTNDPKLRLSKEMTVLSKDISPRRDVAVHSVKLCDEHSSTH
ncbi:brain and acute leukemia cytoplasmic protein [Electrophorus electricus]|uniref:brain and acute leukemia cytoplasmic protein n=1 Tax=Electrophorus electricus TaxID=8005 RepID=UPI0015CFC908|nr:brain and acute leukemia cytoplasmic protein [Electrophorus electricus]